MYKTKLLASSPTLEGINKIINEYFYSVKTLVESKTGKQWDIADSKGAITIYYEVNYRSGRYRFEEILSK